MATAPTAPTTFVISITPFDADGALDEADLRAHLRRLAASGIGVYLGGSGSGEGYTLEPDEVRRVLEIGVEELRGRVPVRAMGVEPRSAREMIRLGRLAADLGVDALQVYSLDVGHGNRPRADELRRYYADVLDAVDLPVVLSSHQSVGYALPVELIRGLVDESDAIVGVNCSHNDLTYVAQLIDAVAGDVDVHVGGPMHALSCLALGGHGYLSSEGNLTPRLCTTVVDTYGRGDFSACHAAYARVMRLHAETRRLGGIAATKAALAMLGLPGGTVRGPRLPVSDAVRAEIARMLDDLQIAAAEGLR
ncbi:MAG: dihydrodipicolinate synthase family protein [Acidimicrobiia bacterium]